MMELNAKSPFLWDWENLVMFRAKASEPPNKLQLVESEIEAYEVGSFYSSGGRTHAGTVSDLGYASSSKSSKSTSSTDTHLRGTHFSLVNNSGMTLTRTSPTIECSAASTESLIALELGKRTYFEDDSGANNPPSHPKPKSSCLNSESPRCQVEGCNLDLSSAKDYHRKHRVCQNHSKSPKVVISGIQRRFCQQCSRFHGLSEFDLKKRSCRRRLSDHNARRRKPKPEVIQFNTMSLAPSLYEGRSRLNLAFDQVSMHQNRHDSAKDSKMTIKKPSICNTMKPGVPHDLHSTHNGLQEPATKGSHVSAQLTPSKGVASDVYQQGLPISVATSNLAATQDSRALSLLSTSLWGPCDPVASITHHTMDAVPLGRGQPIWHTDEQQATSGRVSQTSAFQLFKPNESSFYLY